jgi:HK97 family phage major capsid protein
MSDDCTGELTDFEVKAAGDQRIITGWASTPRVDRHGDRVDPLGVRFTNPVKLLLFHDKQLPVGNVTFDPPTAEGVSFTATLPHIPEPGPLRERVELAWQSIKAGLLSKVSPGWRPLAAVIRNATGGADLPHTEFCELSLVTIEANPDAVITRFKALDLPQSAVPDVAPERRTMTTIQEQITHWTSERAPLVARMTEMLSTDKTLGEVEQKQYDELAERVAAYDAQTDRLRVLEQANVAKAVPLAPATVPVAAKTFHSIRVAPTTPPGTAFIRAACARIVKHGNDHEAMMYAEQRWPDMPEVALYLKAAVAPGTTTDATWAGPLAQPRVVDEFIALLRPKTAIGQIGFKRVPFNTKIPAQTGGGTYGWVGEQKPKPVTKLAFSSLTVPYHKTAGIVVITEELARLSSPAAEDVVRNDMIAGITAFVDAALIDPTKAAVANVSPASITNGTSAITSTGPLGDLIAIANAMTAANMPIQNLTYIMSPSNAYVLALQKNANGIALFPEMTASGGSVNGMKVVTSGAAGTTVVGVIPELVLYADDGGITIDVSREASLQMSDAPMDPADATTVFVSLWQNNCVGLRAEWFITWLKAIAGCCRYVSGATYTVPAGQLMAESAPPSRAKNGAKE